MERKIFDITKEATLENASSIRALIELTLTKNKLSKDLISKASLCFTEVFTNCVKHGKSRFTRVSISTSSSQLRLEILDDGEAINPNTINQALNSFDEHSFNLDEESGRGLFILSKLTDSYDIQLACEQEAASSSPWMNKFSIHWKLNIEKRENFILIVEDDPAQSTLYAAFLSDEYHVYTVNNGMEAIELLQSTKVDAVISDINMPHMSGIELKRKLSENSKTALIPFIFLTMEDSQQIQEKALGLGIDDYLYKPVDKATLKHSLQRVFTRLHQLSSHISLRVDQQISAALTPELPNQIFDWNIRLDARNTGLGGGDVVLHHKTQNSAFLIVMDVMGHNDTAKFFSYAYAGFLKGLLLALGNKLSPSILLAQLSNEIYNDSLLSQLNLTCCILQLGPGRKIIASAAGHPSPLAVSDQNIGITPVSGMMLGLTPNQEYSNVEIFLSEGQRIAMYTDGLFEAVSNSTERNKLEQKVIESLKEHSTSTINQALKQTMKIFDQQTKNKPNDDALLILLENKGKTEL